VTTTLALRITMMEKINKEQSIGWWMEHAFVCCIKKIITITYSSSSRDFDYKFFSNAYEKEDGNKAHTTHENDSLNAMVGDEYLWPLVGHHSSLIIANQQQQISHDEKSVCVMIKTNSK